MKDLDLIAYYLRSYNTEDMRDSREYYAGYNIEINNRQMLYECEGALHEDPLKANEKIATNDYRTIVDQLKAYLLGKQPVLADIDDVISKQLWKVAKKAAKVSQIESVAWIQVYINKRGKLDFLVHNESSNIIPVFGDDVEQTLEKVLRWYDTDIIDGSEIKSIKRCEVWDSEKVTYYDNVEGENWSESTSVSVNPRPHITTGVKYSNGTTAEVSVNKWGRVPFIPMYFNDEKQTMLEVIGKQKIDSLDFLMSDGCNNFADLADAMYILTGYNGPTEGLLHQLKVRKVITTGEGGDVKQLNNEIPMTSRKIMIDLMKDAIYSDGQAVNLKGLVGSTITNVLIKAYFAALDLKSDNLADQITNLYTDLLTFVEIHASGFKDVVAEEPTIQFNKSIIINESEMIKSANESTGNMSKVTQLAMYPNISDPQEEYEKMQEEDSGTYEEVTNET